jgi:hypothetical protein
MNYATEAVINAIKSLDQNQDKPGLEYVQYLKEFRTLSLGLPRRAGKSTTAVALHNCYSSQLFTKYTLGHRYIPFDLETELRRIRGRSFNGLKYSCSIFDEYQEVPADFYRYLSELRREGMLADSYFTINLYTPR